MDSEKTKPKYTKKRNPDPSNQGARNQTARKQTAQNLPVRKFDMAFDGEQNIIKSEIISKNVIILTSDTGLGKTTRVPLYMTELFTRKGLDNEYFIRKIGGSDWIESRNITGQIDSWYISNLYTTEQNNISSFSNVRNCVLVVYTG